MDPEHRISITKNIPTLVKLQHFQDVCEKLIHAGVYTQTMLEEVLVGPTGEGTTEKCRLQRLLLNLPTRGPDAFRHFIETLKSTDNKELANELLLDVVAESKEIAQIPVDEVDSSQSQFSESQLMMLQKRQIEIEVIVKSSSLIISSEIATLEHEESKDLEEDHGNSRFVTFSSQAEESPKYTVKPALVHYNGYSNEGECYNMKSNPRGLALILNNIDFPGDPDAKRLGAENDSENLKSLLEQMGYEVIVKTNVTKKELLDRETGTLANFLEMFSTKNVDSCIVSINSHGFDRDWIRMSDPPGRDEKSTAIDLVEDIFQRFNNRHFPVFQGRPKIFLINACRGNNFNRVVRSPIQNTIRTQSDGVSPLKTGSEFSDFLILRSTVPEYVSMRDLDKGTWFVQCICKAFSLHSFDQEFHGLKRKVNEFMEELVDEDSKIKQSCHYEEFGTNKLLYFNPGL